MPTIKDIAPESVFTIELNAGTPGRQGSKGEQGIQGIQGPKGEPGPKPIRGIDYFTQQDISNMVTTVTGNSNSAFNENVANKTKEFNANVSAKTSAFDNNAVLKTEEFNTNANSKKTDFNLNANNRTTEFNTNASNKKNEIDTYVTNKTTEFDKHVENKVNEFKEETSEYVTENELESKGYLVESDLNDYAKEKDLFSGSYNDLKDKPKIPSKTSELTNDKGFINAIPSEYVTEEEQNEFIKPYNKRIEENEKYISDLEATIDILTNTNTKKGELVHITDGLPLPIYETKVDGNIEQEGEPSPTSPQEIEVLEGYNEFDKNNANVIDGYFHGTTSNITSNSDRKIIYIPAKPNTTYTLSTPENIITSNMFAVGYTTELPAIGIEVKNINYSSGRIKTITTGEDALYLVALIYRDGYTLSYEEVLDGFQIVKGTDIKPYIPYGCVGVKNVGKNILSVNMFIDTIIPSINTGQNISSTGNTATSYIEIDNSLPLIYSTVQTGKGKYAFYYDENYNYLGYITNSSETYLKISNASYYQNAKYIRIRLDGLTKETITKAQLEYNEVATEIEDYKEQIVPLDLKENWVGKINDNIKDYLVTDKKRLWLDKSLTKEVLNGEDNPNISYISYDSSTKRIQLKFKDGIKVNKDSADFLCSHYRPTLDFGDVYTCVRYGDIYYFYVDDTIKSVSDWNTKLKESPMTMIYQTNETKREELGELPEPIKTFEGVNNIQLLANLDTEIEVKYGLDLKKYYDNKLAEISAQII